MIAHVSPAAQHYTDTLATVQLASRIHRMRRRKIKVGTVAFVQHEHEYDSPSYCVMQYVPLSCVRYFITNRMQPSPCWEADTCKGSWDISHIWWNLMVYQCVSKILPQVDFLRWNKWFMPSVLFKIYFMIALPSMTRSGLLNLLCSVGNFGKTGSAREQHEIPNTEWWMNNDYIIWFMYFYASCTINM
jgi:hypothetical protein